MKKILSVAVPSYNSQDYLDRSINSLVGDNRVEVIIVNDGSTDKTPELAEKYQKQYPDIIKVINKENGGHGSAVNAGLEAATGAYFKVVDSDDWVDSDVLVQILDFLEKCIDEERDLDLLISNFIYDKVGKKHKKTMKYRRELPTDIFFNWSQMGHFPKGTYILMHSVIFRTKMLKDCGIKLPEHCFYVDNIYVFNPLPYVKKIYYMDVPFYHYYIGRDDQSVNQEVMIKRLDQQAKVNIEMVKFFTDENTKNLLKGNKKLKKYMYNYLEIITTITSVLAIYSGDTEKMSIKDKVWTDIHEISPALHHKMYHGFLGFMANRKTKVSYKFIIAQYKIVQKIYNFN
ncbi:MAG: glycosyltransferase family 2 protein [Lachnospiraceae bacterium]|nr:glycosyltransferase family 2 protein [Lachnospiraceae bacterium]